MQKKLLALAVAGALAPAAAMAQSSVEIYGRANLSFDNWRATGATAGSAADFKGRNRIVDSGSRLGFRVNEGLGGGLRAFVVMETGVNIDNGNQTGQSGATNASTGTWASRDSYVGLGGGWGDVRMGRQSIWWSNGVIAQTGANYINSAVDGMITGGRSGVAIPIARASNVISYNTPTFGGFNASLSYSPTSEAAAAGAEADGRILGLTGRYTSGALRAQVDWASTRAATPTTGPRAENTGLKFGLGWAYAPGSQISAIHSRIENENATPLFAGGTATTETRKTTVNLINWEHMMGQWQLMAQYAWSGDIDGLSVDPGELGSKGYTLAAKYFLSKRTGVYVSWNAIRNENNAWSDLSGGGFSSAGGTGLAAANAGADPRIIAVGIHHNF